MMDAFLGLTKNKPTLVVRNKKGQFAIEAVLLMTVMMGLFLFVTDEIKKRKLLPNLVTKPIESVGRMAAFGTWNAECKGVGKPTPAKLGKCHPNSIHRSLSSDPQ